MVKNVSLIDASVFAFLVILGAKKLPFWSKMHFCRKLLKRLLNTTIKCLWSMIIKLAHQIYTSNWTVLFSYFLSMWEIICINVLLVLLQLQEHCPHQMAKFTSFCWKNSVLMIAEPINAVRYYRLLPRSCLRMTD